MSLHILIIVPLFFRKVFVMELQERELVVSSTIFVNLCETDFTVPRVAEKVAETLNTTVTVTLMDNKNHELQDCPATQGIQCYFSSILIIGHAEPCLSL